MSNRDNIGNCIVIDFDSTNITERNDQHLGISSLHYYCKSLNNSLNAKKLHIKLIKLEIIF